MKLYNTLTRQIEEIKSLRPNELTIYTCGPTVYDYPHVGNWFTFIRYDLLIRAAKIAGFRTNWVMNITDVGHLVSDADEGEDKLEKGAKREGKTAWEVADFYSNYFTEGLKRLNITEPDYLPKATEHISEQIDLVQRLEAGGYTYQIDDGIYFDTSKFPGYASFARLDLDDLQAGARVEYNQQKRNPSDFALWKFTPEGQNRDMEWGSPWGDGFPGWHLECSAMSMKYLGETIDIHSGGIDHVPVHHTNEIAQSEAVTGKRFANYWMHTNHISVNGEKISKSLGNGITLEDIQAQGFRLEAFRLHVLESHYRSQSKFSWESLEAAQNRLKGFEAFADLQFQVQPDAALIGDDYFLKAQTDITSQLLNDLDTPSALAKLNEVFNYIETNGGGLHPRHLEDFRGFLHFIDDIFALGLSSRKDITSEQLEILKERQYARSEKNWARSDELRNKLAESGISVKDYQQGQIWSRL